MAAGYNGSYDDDGSHDGGCHNSTSDDENVDSDDFGMVSGNTSRVMCILNDSCPLPRSVVAYETKMTPMFSFEALNDSGWVSLEHIYPI